MTDVSTPQRNWARNVTYRAARLHRPATTDELRRTVAENPRIRALGSGHSFSLVADTTADLVRLDLLPAGVELDTAGRTVRVSAGTTYARLATELHRAGFALANLASLPHISVAGSCATATHGSGATLGCLASAVRAVELVGPDGDLLALSRDSHPDTFPGTVAALGALGVVAGLTLDVEPTYEVSQRMLVDVPLDAVQESPDDVFATGYSVSVFTKWHGGRANVLVKRRPDRPAGPWSWGRQATVPVHPVPEQSAENCTAQLDQPGPWHERLPHFRPEYVPGSGRELQSEYFVPRHRAAEAIAAVRQISDRLAPVLQISELRVVREDDLWLSPAYRRDSLTLHFTWADDLAAVLPAIEAVEEQLRHLEPRPHWGKLTRIPPREIAAGYPRATDFDKLRNTVDPHGKFRNDFVDALFPATSRPDPTLSAPGGHSSCISPEFL
ncbi:putative xylitol oxidase [Actinoplanes cyaneus]|uniref:Xylitol oxidase n=1 Tax=Actinoplanes cyaneus TaxID=52696 RepID=A0A919M9C8_9ACTN|nr:D-arabinono-1,4-lactone oxidase [Actinoplanes cyaneus]MCW2144052.1 xylitol oxidase [Actinoplanes cyaneus]GID70732.1 putative xylitol oxidase [Actinoplanes cyaneus]